MIKKRDLTKEDKKTWEEYIKDPSDIFDKDRVKLTENNKNERYKFDLHGFTLDEANKKVKEIILSCSDKKFREILFITGKGLHSTNEKDVFTSKDLGKLKFSVPEFIRSDQDIKGLIYSISDAETKDGGQGAILIKLRNL